MTNSQKRKQVTALFGAYSKRLEALYDKFIDRLTVLAHKSGVGVEDFLEKNVLYRFGNFPELRQELNEIFADYVQKDVLAYRAGITDGVALAYAHDASVLSGFSVLSDKAITAARNTAAATFIRNRMKPATGLGLSQLVWNYCSQTKSEFEMAVSNVLADGLKKGTSAASLGLLVRQYLNNPDMMYRRYHRTVVDAQGNKKDIVKWRRRVVDDDGKVRFVEEPLEKVGMGHYRSSKKNADRLMRTEINGAYHRANAERWQTEPFVIGIVIDLSPQHPAPDECDELAGRYPKDFIFTGWHPQCLCMSNPITIQGEEKKEFYRRLASGEDMSGYVSPNAVKDIPDSAKAWIDANKEQFIRAAERGKLGWIWRDNMKYVGRQFTPEELTKMGYQPSVAKVKRVKTEAEKADIQRRWNERRIRLLREEGSITAKQAAELINNPSPANLKNTEKAISHSVMDVAQRYVTRYTGDQNPIKEVLDTLNAEKDGIKRIHLINELKKRCAAVTDFDLKYVGAIDSNFSPFKIDPNYQLQASIEYGLPNGQKIKMKEKLMDLVVYKDKFGKEYCYPIGVDPYNLAFKATDASKFVGEMPVYMRKNFKGMLFCNETHPLDQYWIEWNKIKGTFDFQEGAMYSGDRIYVRKHTIRDFKENLAHEIGHNIDKKVGIQKTWQVVMDADGNSIRGYSAHNPVEDIADSWSLWITDRAKLKKEFPHRYDAIRSYIKQANR